MTMRDVGGKLIEYELREMTANERDRYLDLVNKRIGRNAEGEVKSIAKFEGMHAELLVRTLVRKDSGNFVAKDEVDKWPGGAIAEIYKAAQTLNHLGDTEKEEKND